MRRVSRGAMATAAGLLLLLGPGAAHAGALTYGYLALTVQGHSLTIGSNTAYVGGSTATSAYLYPGVFAGITFQTTPAPAPATVVTLHLGQNGALLATPSGVRITAPITGSTLLKANNGYLTFQKIPISLGAVGTVHGTTLLGGPITVINTGWHLGRVSATGTFTRSGAVLPTHTVATTGSFNMRGGGYTYSTGSGTVSLVTIRHVIVGGPSPSNTVSPTSMKLTFVADGAITPPLPPGLPEPGSLLLLAAAGAGLVGFARARRR